MIQSDRYEISVNDICGYEQIEVLTTAHFIWVFLRMERAKISTEWQDSYEGFIFYTYYIFRGTNKSDFVKIGSIQNNLTSRTDTTSITGHVFYIVAAVKPDGHAGHQEIVKVFFLLILKEQLFNFKYWWLWIWCWDYRYWFEKFSDIS